MRCFSSNNTAVPATQVPADLGAVVHMAAGENFICALTVGKVVRCWGEDEFSVVSDAPTAQQGQVVGLSCGGVHCCALFSTSALSCWGWNEYGQASPPIGLPPVAAVSCGDFHCCVLLKQRGSVRCWGLDNRGQVGGKPSDAELGPVIALRCSSSHCCAIRDSDGRLTCWGRFFNDTSPAPPLVLGRVLQLGGPAEGACALRDDRSVLCWGDNFEPLMPDDGGTGQYELVARGWALGVGNYGRGHVCGLVRRAGA